MTRVPVAPRLITWALILLGSGEVVWVIYLALTQDRVVRIFHVRLATLGLGGFAAVLCLAAAVALLRDSRLVPALGVAVATTMAFLASLGSLTPGLDTSGLLGSGERPLLVAAPSVLAGGYAAWASLRTGGPTGWAKQLTAAVLAASAIVVAARVVLHVATWNPEALSTQTRAIIVILDAAETVGLLGAGLASLFGHPRATLVLATIAGSLLLCDAYGNVVMAASGEAFTAAIFYLIVGEIPSIVVCFLAVRAALRSLHRPQLPSPALV